MSSPIGAINFLLGKVSKRKHDDHWSDRLYYVAVPYFLLFLAGLHGLKQYFGKPVECFPPAEMARKSWMDYAEGLCFVEDTYYVGMNEQLPMERVDRQQRQIHYYQWVPFLLAGQALLFVIPKMLWMAFSEQTGLDMNSLLERCHAFEKHWKKGAAEQWSAGKVGRAIGNNLEQTIEWRNQQKRIGNVYTDKHHVSAKPLGQMSFDSHATLYYLGFKLLNLIVTIVQMHLLNWFFAPTDHNSSNLGFEVLLDMMAGRDWHHTGLFPRVTICDILIRQPQRDLKPLRYSFQCLLKMNMYNEKIFLISWFILFALALFGSGNFLYWCYHLINWNSAEKFIRKNLRLNPSMFESTQSKELPKFVRYHLGRDCITTLRLISFNCSPVVTEQIISHLWELYQLKNA